MKFIKSKLFLVLITTIIVGSVGVYAGVINANDIAYDSTHTVKDKIDDLYNTSSILETYKNKFDSFTFSFYAQSYNNAVNSNAGISTSPFKDFYKYFKVTAVDKTSGNGTCTFVGWNGSATNLSINTGYLTNEYTNIYVRAKSSGSEETQCRVTVNFYN